MKSKLNEGLRENDLEDLVLPLLSIDEFESKIDDDAVVLGFYVKDSDPAQDLNRFIQKSPVSLLDSDVSPAPNEDGYFLVFVELVRDPSLSGKILTILEEIKSLVNLDVDSWQFTCYGHEAVFDLTEENLYILLRTEPIEDLIQQAEDDFNKDVMEFLKPSILDDVLVEADRISMTRGQKKLGASLVAFGESDDPDIIGVTDGALQLTETARNAVRTYESLLGAGWHVAQYGDIITLSNAIDTRVLCVR